MKCQHCGYPVQLCPACGKYAEAPAKSEAAMSTSMKAAEILYNHGHQHGWNGFAKTWDEFKTDQIGLDEFLVIVDQVRGVPAQQTPIAYVPVHPRTGPLWSETFPAGSEVHRSEHYERMALYAAPLAEQPPRKIERDSLVEKLRDTLYFKPEDTSSLCNEAADYIELLEARSPAESEPFGYVRVWNWPDVSPDFYQHKPTTELEGTEIVPVYRAPCPSQPGTTDERLDRTLDDNERLRTEIERLRDLDIMHEAAQKLLAAERDALLDRVEELKTCLHDFVFKEAVCDQTIERAKRLVSEGGGK